ncbi:hypothetical protein [Sorangium sp. So ce233]|uniref:hypothetical protein n=1 Tax=Sorangium sp. So ce233 TaxID=3133290 RepID=UPI003F634E88
MFVAGLAGGGDDKNPGTKAKPVFSVQRAVDLAREGRGRVFVCSDGFEGNVRLPAGVDLLGGFNCWRWGRDLYNKVSTLQVNTTSDPVVIVEPAGSGDTGAADGVSTIADMRMRADSTISVLIRSNTVVEILRSEVMTSYGWGGGDGEEWPGPNRAADGPDGRFGGDGCSAGAGGCGGRGGRGGGNGHPTIGSVALHAKLTVRDTVIMTLDGGPGGNGGPPERGGKPGRGGPGAALDDGTWSCAGGKGGSGGTGGYGGPGRGGDSIGIAYLDEDQLTLEGVGYELAPPGKGGMSWNHDGSTVSAEDGVAVETLRFPEP